MVDSNPSSRVSLDQVVVDTSSIYTFEDPLAFVTRPPARENAQERAERLQREADARRVSDAIDANIRKEQIQRKKNNDVKLLLLGQAESGKSTLLKQWQLTHAPERLESERFAWRPVVYHNIARAVAVILAVLEAHDDDYYDPSTGPRDASPPRPSSIRPPMILPQRTSTQNMIANLRLRLSPLVAAERLLAERLSGGLPRPSPVIGADGRRPAENGVLFVKAGWKRRAESSSPTPTGLVGASAGAMSPTGRFGTGRDELLENVAAILTGSQGDIVTLWELPMVRRLVERRRLRFDEWAEYFLTNISRVSASDYVPTIEDTLRARIQTLGVEEHTFMVNSIDTRPHVWRVFDVGGARGQRHAWVPYFDEAHAIIFLAPVSAFDQWLDEDPRTNRLDDSMKLFESICAHPLLKKVMLVLFLNKTDILEQKLARGVRVDKYITSFGDRPNEYVTVLEYFKGHFQHMHRKHNSGNRWLYTHYTRVVDSRDTQKIMKDVRDNIMRGLLSAAALT